MYIKLKKTTRQKCLKLKEYVYLIIAIIRTLPSYINAPHTKHNKMLYF